MDLSSAYCSRRSSIEADLGATPVESQRATQLHQPGRLTLELLGVTSLALVLRLAGLDRKSVWFDEALGVQAALLPLGQLFETVGAERNPPLYFVIQHFWIPLQSGDWWLRLPAAVAGTAGVSIATLFACEVLGRDRGVFAGLMIAVSPMAIDLSQEARPYALFFLCASGSLVCLAGALSRSSRWWIGFIGATVLTLDTHNYAVLLVIAEAAFVVLWMVR